MRAATKYSTVISSAVAATGRPIVATVPISGGCPGCGCVTDEVCEDAGGFDVFDGVDAFDAADGLDEAVTCDEAGSLGASGSLGVLCSCPFPTRTKTGVIPSHTVIPSGWEVIRNRKIAR